MKKLVNGRVIDIKNIDLFERAGEGLALNREVSNKTIDLTGINVESIIDKVSIYKNIYSRIPYPLYAIETDLKYCVIAEVMKEKYKISSDIYVEDGLYIKLGNGKAIYFLNDSWGIVDKEFVEKVDFGVYRDESEFKDYKWLLDTLMEDRNTKSYIRDNMKEFVGACQNKPMILTWEIGEILNFGSVPDRLSLYDNRIVDLENKRFFDMDIYSVGIREERKKDYFIDIVSGKSGVKKKYRNVYGFDVYKKESVRKNKPRYDMRQKVRLPGMLGVFLTLNGIKEAKEDIDFTNYKGFIVDGRLIFEIDNRVFYVGSDYYDEVIEIAKGVNLIGYDRNMVYMMKKSNIGNGINKETIYSYSFVDNSLRLCKIQFVRG